jgi:hypothetical protein
MMQVVPQDVQIDGILNHRMTRHQRITFDKCRGTNAGASTWESWLSASNDLSVINTILAELKELKGRGIVNAQLTSRRRLMLLKIKLLKIRSMS